eukprot:CAMPEP_0174991058 /NCGR_PEP_ID=MMETSP0004_2-20121128/21664_1 /TAXON_ID=420556 /ORGANISM="Ochromonas sp., Strain CCMP1393" /LENGTH=103 /DNA_ID=CAMNT_0016244731 /DNA_START=99 /DNA_END=410 /DNA_ORIENTATION=-
MVLAEDYESTGNSHVRTGPNRGVAHPIHALPSDQIRRKKVVGVVLVALLKCVRDTSTTTTTSSTSRRGSSASTCADTAAVELHTPLGIRRTHTATWRQKIYRE